MKYIQFPFLSLSLSILMWMLVSCGNEPATATSQTQSPTETPSQTENTAAEATTTSETQATTTITSILLSYYNDLSQEQLDETVYFAPTVNTFFASKNVSRETVANSVRKGFESLESRSIVLDRKSLTITPTDDGYIAEFKGTSTVKRKGESSSSQDAFHNRVGFNQDFLITSYEAAPSSSTTTRQVASEDSGPTIKAVTSAILPELRTARFARIHQYIHPKKGYYLMTHPGAVSVPFHYQKIEEIFTQAPWLKKGMTTLSASTKEEALPDFDCGIMFSKEGSFLSTISGYEGVSDLMKTLALYELGSFEEEQIEQAKELEQYITHALIDTEEAIALYFGQVDGQWYLLVVDIASYDCSA